MKGQLSLRHELALRLIETALERFGRLGFEGASTRDIARASGTAMSSITYHFGGKQGLYLACADYIVAVIGEIYAPLTEAIRADPPRTADAARTRLLDLLETFARFLLTPLSADFAQFIAREQQHPTEAFDRLYEGLMRPLIETAIELMEIARPSLTDKERRALAMNLVGTALILRLGRACVVRTMQVEDIDEDTARLLLAGLRRSAETLLTEA